MDWQMEVDGSHEWAAERWLPELGHSQFKIDKVANPKSILDLQPTGLLFKRPMVKEDLLYLRHLRRLTVLETNTVDLFNQIEAPCLDQLRTLSVADKLNNMSESSALALGRSLKQFTQLTHLVIFCQNLGDAAPKMAPFMAHVTALQVIALLNTDDLNLSNEGMKELVPHLSKLAQLTRLNLFRLIDTASLSALCDLISSLPRLSALELPANEFTPESIEMLCEPISKLSNLTQLNLSYSTLDEQSVNALAKALTHLPLIHLKLNATFWIAGGFDALVAQFEHWTHLKALSLGYLPTSEEKSSQLATHLSKLTSLILLDIEIRQPDLMVGLVPMLIPSLKSLPLQALFFSCAQITETSEILLKEAFPNKRLVKREDYFLIHDTSLPTKQYLEYTSLLLDKKPVVAPIPLIPPYWAQFRSFKPIKKNQWETYLMQPMLYRHFRYPEQACLLWTQQDWDVSFLESVLLDQLPTPPDMNRALTYHRWSEIVGYNPGLIHYGDYIQQHVTVDNLVSTFGYFHELKKTVLPQRDASGEHLECTGESDLLVCWDGLLSYLVSKWIEWCLRDDTKEQLFFTAIGCVKVGVLLWKSTKPLQCEWTMKEDVVGDWERRQRLFKTTYHFLHLSPSLRPDMTVVINNGLKVMHLHSHVVWKRWGLSSKLQSQARLLGNRMSAPMGVIYHLELSPDMAVLVGCLLEYCYTGDVAKLTLLTAVQIGSIGQWRETTIYSVIWAGDTPQVDPHLENWCKGQLGNK